MRNRFLCVVTAMNHSERFAPFGCSLLADSFLYPIVFIVDQRVLSLRSSARFLRISVDADEQIDRFSHAALGFRIGPIAAANCICSNFLLRARKWHFEENIKTYYEGVSHICRNRRHIAEIANKKRR